MRSFARVGAAIGVFCAMTGGARADPIEDFYRGKTVTILVGQPAGGTYDLYARMIGRFLGSHIPGKPNVVVQNMPGAGGLTAAFHVSNGQPDGTEIAATAAALPFQPLIDPGSTTFQPTAVNWMPTPATYGVFMLVGRNAPAKTFEDLLAHETVMSTLSPGQLPSLLVAATNGVLAAKIKAVNGYPNLNDSMLALARGEIDGYPAMPFDALKRSYAAPLARGDFRLVLQFGPAKSADFPDVPYAPDLAKSDADRRLIELAMTPLRSGYPYMVGPTVPNERVAALRRAMMETFADPAYRSECERLTLTVAPVSGEAVQAQIAETYATPQAIVERMRAIYKDAR